MSLFNLIIVFFKLVLWWGFLGLASNYILNLGFYSIFDLSFFSCLFFTFIFFYFILLFFPVMVGFEFYSIFSFLVDTEFYNLFSFFNYFYDYFCSVDSSLLFFSSLYILNLDLLFVFFYLVIFFIFVFCFFFSFSIYGLVYYSYYCFNSVVRLLINLFIEFNSIILVFITLIACFFIPCNIVLSSYLFFIIIFLTILSVVLCYIDILVVNMYNPSYLVSFYNNLAVLLNGSNFYFFILFVNLVLFTNLFLFSCFNLYFYFLLIFYYLFLIYNLVINFVLFNVIVKELSSFTFFYLFNSFNFDLLSLIVFILFSYWFNFFSLFYLFCILCWVPILLLIFFKVIYSYFNILNIFNENSSFFISVGSILLLLCKDCSYFFFVYYLGVINLFGVFYYFEPIITANYASFVFLASFYISVFSLIICIAKFFFENYYKFKSVLFSSEYLFFFYFFCFYFFYTLLLMAYYYAAVNCFFGIAFLVSFIPLLFFVLISFVPFCFDLNNNIDYEGFSIEHLYGMVNEYKAFIMRNTMGLFNILVTYSFFILSLLNNLLFSLFIFYTFFSSVPALHGYIVWGHFLFTSGKFPFFIIFIVRFLFYGKNFNRLVVYVFPVFNYFFDFSFLNLFYVVFNDLVYFNTLFYFLILLGLIYNVPSYTDFAFGDYEDDPSFYFLLAFVLFFFSLNSLLSFLKFSFNFDNFIVFKNSPFYIKDTSFYNVIAFILFMIYLWVFTFHCHMINSGSWFLHPVYLPAGFGAAFAIPFSFFLASKFWFLVFSKSAEFSSDFNISLSSFINSFNWTARSVCFKNGIFKPICWFVYDLFFIVVKTLLNMFYKLFIFWDYNSYFKLVAGLNHFCVACLSIFYTFFCKWGAWFYSLIYLLFIFFIDIVTNYNHSSDYVSSNPYEIINPSICSYFWIFITLFMLLIGLIILCFMIYSNFYSMKSSCNNI